jgi:hypothetical protein
VAVAPEKAISRANELVFKPNGFAEKRAHQTMNKSKCNWLAALVLGGMLAQLRHGVAELPVFLGF